MRALVTGCAGFIGSHLTEALLAAGHDVLGVDCFTDNYDAARKHANLAAASEHPGFELRRLDLADAPLDALVGACDAVFHLAAEPGVRSSWGTRFDRYLRNNLAATQRLLEAATATPSKRFVYASSSSIYGDAERLPTPEDVAPAPFSPYGATKLAAEHLCRLYHGNLGLETVGLRYFSVYGPRQRPDMAFERFCRAAVRGEQLTVYGDGEQTRDFTFVGDAVEATLAAAWTPGVGGRVYNVGGGSQVRLNDALALLAELAGPLDVRYAERERGDVRSTGADVARARAELGWRPRVSFEDGFRAELAWAAAREPAGVRVA
jgi:nucleoside-diphosphate-sugar epimerase